MDLALQMRCEVAKNKDESEDLEFDFDDDLNFDLTNDDSGIDGIAAASNVEPKKRSPVVSAFKGAISGAKSTVLSEKSLRTFASNALPKEYETIGSAVEEVAGGVGELYRNTAKEIKPTAERFTKILDKMGTDENSRARKISEKIKDKLGIYSVDSGPSKAQQEEESISNSLASVFANQNNLQAHTQAREDIKDDLDRKVEAKRFTSEQGLLSSINTHTSTLANYEVQVTQAYQKKSLELQYRSYFVMAESLNKTKEYFEIFKTQNDSIVKNTALPEYTKIENSERFKDLARTKFFDSIQGRLFNPESTIRKGFEKLGSKLKNEVRNITDAFQMGMEAGEQMVDMIPGQQSDMDGLGIDMGDEMTAPYMIGETVAGAVLDNPIQKLAARLGNWSRSTIAPNNGKIDRWGKQAYGYAVNPEGFVQDMLDSDKLSDINDNPLKKLARYILEPFRGSGPDLQLATQGGVGDVTKSAMFDNRVYRSITDIIPGYLARILQQTTISAQSISRNKRDKRPTVEMERYDYDTGSFIKETELSDRITDRFSKIDNTRLNNHIDIFLKTFKLDKKLTEEQQYALREALIRWSMSGKTITLKALSSSAFLRMVDKQYRSTIKNRLDNITTYPDQVIKHTGMSYKSTIDQLGTNLKSSMVQHQGDAQQLLNAGYGDVTDRLGITKTEKGKTELQQESYIKRLAKLPKGYAAPEVKFDKEDDIATSDIHAKENITPYQGVLERLSNIKNYQWNYKRNRNKYEHEDQGTQTGPMAQTVHSQFGSQAAPGGTKINLTTMNGINMQAIKELNEKVDNGLLESNSESISLLKQIADNTFKMANKFKGRLSYNESDDGNIPLTQLTIGNAVGKLASEATAAVTKILNGGFKATASVFNFGKDTVVKPITSEITRLVTEHKSAIGDKLSELVGGVWDVAGSILKTTKKITFDAIPTTIKDVYSMGKSALKTVGDMFNGPIDIYIGDEVTPRITAQLMRMGAYIDKTTGKVIEKLDDIKGDIVDLQGNAILAASEVHKGLFDKYGNELKSLKQTITDFVVENTKKGFRLLGNIGKYIGGKALSVGKGMGGIGFGNGGKYQKYIYNVLLDIRDIAIKQLLGRKGKLNLRSYKDEKRLKINEKERSEAIKDVANTVKELKQYVNKKEISKKIKDTFDQNLSWPKWSNNTKPETKSYDSQDYADLAKRKLGLIVKPTVKETIPEAPVYDDDDDGEITVKRPTIFDKARQALGMIGRTVKKKTTDVDAPVVAEPESQSGLLEKVKRMINARSDKKPAFNDRDNSGRRDGSWMDRFEKMSQKAKDSIKPQSDKPEVKYRGANIFDNALAKLASIKDMFGSAMDSITEGIGGLDGIRDKFRRRRGPTAKRGLVRRAAGTVGKILKPVANVLFNPLTALKWGGKAAIGAGRLAMAGAGAMGSIGSGALSLLGITGGILASPIAAAIAGVAIVGAVGYGAYKAYQYLTRNSATELDKLRLIQYGFSDEQKDYYHYAWKVEKYIADKATVIENQEAKIITSKINGEELLRLCDIDPEKDTERVANFRVWFNDRFVPVYLMHVTALHKANTKLTGRNLSDISDQDKYKYLTNIKTNISVHHVTESFIPEIDAFTTTEQQAQVQLDKLKADKPKEKSSKPVDKITTPIATPAEQARKAMGIDPSVQAIKPKSPIAADIKSNLDPTLRSGENVSQYVKLTNRSKLEGLNPVMHNRFNGMAQEYGELTGQSIQVNSGYRSMEEQARLHASNPQKAAPPGRSLHEFGLAVDINSSDADKAEKLGLMKKYGFTRPVGGETWHIEPSGIQGNLSQVKNNIDLASQLVAASAHRGGGGYGTEPNSVKYRRNAQIAAGVFGTEAANDAISTEMTTAENSKGVSNVIPIKGNKSTIKEQIQVGRIGGVNNLAVSPGTHDKLASLKTIDHSSKDGLKRMVAEAAGIAGIDPQLLQSVVAIESGFNPSASSSTSSASGLLQFVDKTWREVLSKYGPKYGLGPNAPRSDPVASALMAAEYLKANAEIISDVAPNPTPGQLYATHFLGPTGAKKLFSGDPDHIAAQVLPSAAKSNPQIFNHPDGRPKTVSEVEQTLENKIVNKATEFNISSYAGSANDTRPKTQSTPSTPGIIKTSATIDTPIKTTSAAPAAMPTTPVFRSPSVTNTKQTGDQYNAPALSKQLSNVESVLDKSLSVQEQMLEVLTAISKNLTPEQLGGIIKDLKTIVEPESSSVKTTGMQSQTKPLGNLPINLSRKIA